MHHNKPKSAPARLKCKFIRNRTNAMKEIEAWVRKDNEEFQVPEASRMSGQLSDNVTEERMLKAKLWELSKERYKFLSQNSYEKKLFQDRQQKKSGLRRISSATLDCRKRADSDSSAMTDRPKSSIETGQRTKGKNARFTLLDRLDPTKKRTKARTETSTGAKTKNAEEKMAGSPDVPNISTEVVKRSRDITKVSSDGPKISTNVTKVSTDAMKVTAEVPNDSSDVTKIVQADKQERRLKTPGRPIFTIVPEKEPTESAEVQGSEAETVDTASDRVSFDKETIVRKVPPLERTTSDPRFAFLEKTLCPLTRSKTSLDIGTIVSGTESLHVRPRKRPPDAPKSKIEIKAQDYIKEKGFNFVV